MSLPVGKTSGIAVVVGIMFVAVDKILAIVEGLVLTMLMVLVGVTVVLVGVTVEDRYIVHEAMSLTYSAFITLFNM